MKNIWLIVLICLVCMGAVFEKEGSFGEVCNCVTSLCNEPVIDLTQYRMIEKTGNCWNINMIDVECETYFVFERIE